MIGVVGASGGVGASTMTAALAARAGLALQECCSVVAVDLDSRGGLDVVLGVEHLEGTRWEDVESSAWAGDGDHHIRLAALPAEDGVAVLTARSAFPGDWRTVADTLDALSTQVDVVVVDCGARPAPALLSRLDVVVVVMRGTAKGLRDAVVVDERCELARTYPVVVSRGRPRDRFGPEAARQLAIPFLAHWVDDPRVRRDEAQGRMPGTRASSVDPVADAALRVLQTLWLSALVDAIPPTARARARRSA